MRPAPLKPAANERGAPTLRCEQCGKVAFSGQVAAEAAAKLIEGGVGKKMRPYLGDCGWWHLSSRPKQ
jgi:hypothetical protein